LCKKSSESVAVDASACIYFGFRKDIIKSIVMLTTLVVYVTPLILDYLLRFYIIPATSYKHYSLHQQITIIIIKETGH